MKVCLADTGSYEFLFKEKRARYLLGSFFYLKKKDFSFFQDNDMFILDSGAFTFMSSQKNAKVDWDKYIEEYADFINEHDIQYFFELDIDVIVGIEEVERLRNKLETLTGKKCIPVWHIHRGMDYWKKMLEKYDYVAIGGLVTKEIQRKDYHILKKMVDFANQKGVKVHGLGFTSMEWLKRIKWYSVDSTSWCGLIFSYRFYEFKNKVVKSKTLKGVKDYKRLLKHNYEQWLLFQEYADKNL